MAVIDPTDTVEVEGAKLLNMETDVRHVEWEMELARDALSFLADMHDHQMDNEVEGFASCLRLVAFSLHPGKRPVINRLGRGIRDLIRKEDQ